MYKEVARVNYGTFPVDRDVVQEFLVIQAGDKERAFGTCPFSRNWYPIQTPQDLATAKRMTSCPDSRSYTLRENPSSRIEAEMAVRLVEEKDPSRLTEAINRFMLELEGPID